MKIKLTIAGQPLVLTAKQAGVLFGLSKLHQFAEGKWTPFVFCEPADQKPRPAGSPEYTVTRINNSEDLENFFENEGREVFGFADDVIAAAKDGL